MGYKETFKKGDIAVVLEKLERGQLCIMPNTKVRVEGKMYPSPYLVNIVDGQGICISGVDPDVLAKVELREGQAVRLTGKIEGALQTFEEGKIVWILSEDAYTGSYTVADEFGNHAQNVSGLLLEPINMNAKPDKKILATVHDDGMETTVGLLIDWNNSIDTKFSDTCGKLLSMASNFDIMGMEKHDNGLEKTFFVKYGSADKVETAAIRATSIPKTPKLSGYIVLCSTRKEAAVLVATCPEDADPNEEFVNCITSEKQTVIEVCKNGQCISKDKDSNEYIWSIFDIRGLPRPNCVPDTAKIVPVSVPDYLMAPEAKASEKMILLRDDDGIMEMIHVKNYDRHFDARLRDVVDEWRASDSEFHLEVIDGLKAWYEVEIVRYEEYYV